MESCLPTASIPDHVSPFELQVNLCEWRKFLKLDPQLKLIHKGAQDEPGKPHAHNMELQGSGAVGERRAVLPRAIIFASTVVEV